VSGTAGRPRTHPEEDVHQDSGPETYVSTYADEYPERHPDGELAGIRPERQIALVDLLDRLLTGGVVLTGDLTLSIADVDLVRISLRALITSVTAEEPAPWMPGLDRGEER
jgi:hypothetical protein